MPNLKTHIRRFLKNRDGATAVEAAIVFPIVILCLFAAFGIGTFMYGTHQAQRTVEETARMARVLPLPSEANLLGLLDQNKRSAIFGTYETDVTMIEQFNGQYAELTVTYNFSFALPFAEDFALSSNSSTQVKLRQSPV